MHIAIPHRKVMLYKYSVHVLSLWGTEFQDGDLKISMCPIGYGYFQRAYVGQHTNWGGKVITEQLFKIF